MKKRTLVLLALLIFGSTIAAVVYAACSYQYSYENARVGVAGGQPVCWQTGGTCVEYGDCDGSSTCAEDSSVTACKNQEYQY